MSRVGVNQLLAHKDNITRSVWAQVRDPETGDILREVHIYDVEPGDSVEMWLQFFRPNYISEEERLRRKEEKGYAT